MKKEIDWQVCQGLQTRIYRNLGNGLMSLTQQINKSWILVGHTDNVTIESPHQWATIAREYPAKFERISKLERDLNHTIDSKYSIVELARQGTPYPENPELSSIATNREYQFALTTNLTK